MYDFIIIGAGIIGTTIARELSRYEAKILVLDRSSDVANGQTIANSAVIHSGHDPEPGTLKAQLCVRGNAMYDTLEKELNIPLKRTGALVLLTRDQDVRMLNMLKARAEENGVPEISVLSREALIKVEPNIAENVIMALSLPTTKVTYPWEVAFAAMENAIQNGAEFKNNSLVTAITKGDDGFVLTINHQETLSTRHIINAAGVFADDIKEMTGDDAPFAIRARKGEYLVLDANCEGFVHHVLYPMPDDKGKGVLLIPQVHGNILVGPSSASVFDKDNLRTTADGIKYVITHAKAIAKDIPFKKTIRTFAGIRASSTYGDFYINESKTTPGLFHVAGIDSPGLTAAPAIATHVSDMIMNAYPYPKKAHFDPIRKKALLFRERPEADKQALVSKDNRYARIICKCEQITEKEVIDAIHGLLGCDTIKGIKKRVRAGAGLCQGGYCESTVLKIIAQETGKPVTKIDYYEKDTPILWRETKVKA